jgi:hypothetical protein
LRQQQAAGAIQLQQGFAPRLDDNDFVQLRQPAALPRTAAALEVFNGFPAPPLMDGLGVGVVPRCWLGLSSAFCIFSRTACVVVAVPCSICPVAFAP